MRMKRGQISVEYLIVVGFVIFVVIGMLGVAFYYVAGVQDELKASQLDNFANKIISSSESVFYAGEPSKVTINAYLPSGVSVILIDDDTNLFFEIEFSTGLNKISFSSNVPLNISLPPDDISLNEGLKKLEISAKSSPNRVVIKEVS